MIQEENYIFHSAGKLVHFWQGLAHWGAVDVAHLECMSVTMSAIIISQNLSVNAPAEKGSLLGTNMSPLKGGWKDLER